MGMKLIFFSPVNLSYASLIIRSTKEHRREEGKFFSSPPGLGGDSGSRSCMGRSFRGESYWALWGWGWVLQEEIGICYGAGIGCGPSG